MKNSSNKHLNHSVCFALKKHLYNEPGLGYYSWNIYTFILPPTYHDNKSHHGMWFDHNKEPSTFIGEEKCTAALVQDACDWLWTVYGIQVTTFHNMEGNYYRGVVSLVANSGDHWVDLKFEESHSIHCTSRDMANNEAVSLALRLIDKHPTINTCPGTLGIQG